jgi:division protein CdvB (Snf7/Vps24/ESCRT-III family)
MSKRENVIIMFNKLKTAKTTKNLQEEFEEVYKDLTTTREEIGQAVDKRTEEMQEEMANILAKAITYMTNEQDKEALKYLIDQYKIIIKDLSNNNHEDRQVIIKIF